MPFEIRRKGFRILLLVGLLQHALHPLQNFHQQLHSPHLANIARYLHAVHSLLTRFHLKCLQLLSRHLFKGLIQQVNSGERRAVVVTLQGLIQRVSSLYSLVASAESSAARAATKAAVKAEKSKTSMSKKEREEMRHQGARASEAPDYAELDATLAALGVPAHQVLAVESARIAETEGLSLGEAMTVCARRYPTVAELYYTERS